MLLVGQTWHKELSHSDHMEMEPVASPAAVPLQLELGAMYLAQRCHF